MNRLADLDLKLLITFDTLCRTGSVTRAAEALGQSQGAVSHALRRLRDLFGDDLFVRSRSGLIRTRRGQELSLQVADLLARAEELIVDHAAFNPQAAQRQISLSMMDIGEIAIMPTLLTNIRHAAPGCTINAVAFDPPAIAQNLEDGTVDLAISGMQVNGAQLKRQKLYTHSCKLLASADSNLPDTLELRDYCSLDHVSVSVSSESRSEIEAYLETHGLSRRIVVQTEHFLALPYLIESDPRLVATVPTLLADICVARGRFKIIEVIGGFPRLEVYQFWHQRFDGDSFNIWLRQIVRSAFMRHPIFNI